MEALTLNQKIEKLPESLKSKAEDYIDSLLDELKEVNVNNDIIPQKGFGGMKGFVSYMSEDFEPLKEFHDYMYHISIEFIEKIEKLPVEL